MGRSHYSSRSIAKELLGLRRQLDFVGHCADQIRPSAVPGRAVDLRHRRLLDGQEPEFSPVLDSYGWIRFHPGPAQGGEFVTKPLIFKGSKLEINYSTSAAGSIRVEIQDKDGNPIPGNTLAECHQIFGDEIERTVAWKGGENLKPLAGKPIRLRFELKDADLFSFRFR